MANSIMTNASAMTALKTLNMTNKSLEQTQGRISTGYRVAEAADNAAYWSIATTMRSDNKALSTVKDALGLGAAQVDVAYTAMNSAKDVLDTIKTKLVAASQPGVDKAKVQSEIKQLQDQLSGIASSASFSGSNWLRINSSAAGTPTEQKVVSGFTRAGNGTVSVSTISINTTNLALYDDATTPSSNGLLEGGTSASMTSTNDFAWTPGTMANGGTFTFNVEVDGADQAVTITVGNTATFTLDNLVAGLNAGMTGATAGRSGNKLVLSSTTRGTSSSIEIKAPTGFGATGASIGVAAQAQVNGVATGGSISDINIIGKTDAEISAYIATVDSMTKSVVTAAADLGSMKSRIGMQTDFAKSLMDAVDRGVGQLVDADMNEESTRLQALQVQQQLGVQALSIANSSSQSLLSLFRG